MRSRVVIVGVSTYRQREVFAPLRGAGRDAVWFERFVRERLPDPHEVTCLTGPAATKAAILAAIAGSAGEAREGPERLVVFFSGHGGTLRMRGGTDESVLFCHDTSIADRLATSIRIAELLGMIAALDGTEEIYLFIDACHVTLDALAGQIQPIAAKERRAATFCCVIANDGGVSLEGFASSMGEFSAILLASVLSVDASTSPSIGGLVAEVARRARSTGVTAPISILFGDPSRWLFPRGARGALNTLSTTVPRPEIVEAALEILRSHKSARIFISGPSGTGKSVALQQVGGRLGGCAVAVFARQEQEVPLEVVVQRVVEAVLAANREDSELPPATIDAALKQYADGNGHAVLIIDGGENLSDQAWSLIGEALDRQGVDMITTRHDARIPGMRANALLIAPMHREQLRRLAEPVAPHLSEALLARAEAASGGYPLAFLQAIGGADGAPAPHGLAQAIRHLRLAEGCCDRRLFCALCGLAEADLNRLDALGMLVREGEVERLHDSAPALEVEPDDAAAVVTYWQAELEGRYSGTAALRIVSLAAAGLLRFPPEATTSAIRLAEARATSAMLAAAASNAATDRDRSAVVAAVDILSRRGAADLLTDLLERWVTCGASKSEADPLVSLAMARASWWTGDYQACRKHAEPLLETSTHASGAALEIAIADFFEGRWDKAQDALEPLAKPGAGELRLVGWAQLILGTCLGIRGMSDHRGRRLLRTAAELLRASNDFAGVAIAKSNCGEVGWKLGDFETAEGDLSEGLSIAESLGMTINAVEARRNLIHLHMRWHGPYDRRLTPFVDALENLTLGDIGAMEMMQVGNTMATLHLYRRDTERAGAWLTIVRPLTAGNAEYDIYTLANEGLWLALTGTGGARARIEAALALCAVGSNDLALQQIRHDVVFCIGAAQPRLTNELLRVVDAHLGRPKPCL